MLSPTVNELVHDSLFKRASHIKMLPARDDKSWSRVVKVVRKRVYTLDMMRIDDGKGCEDGELQSRSRRDSMYVMPINVISICGRADRQAGN